jgi:NAD(P)-dependent dehydrogenase (short-subunit alcohol dehydrogenase family)
MSTPYAAAYAAAKFGARALSEAIRAEMRHLPNVHVCDVFPAFVDTPGLLHAANYTGRDVRSMSGGIDPRTVAASVVRTALDPRPTTVIGAPQAAIVRLAHGLMPQLTAAIFAAIAERAFAARRPAPDTSGAILQPMHGGREIDNPGAARSQARRLAPGVAVAALIGIVGYAASRRLQAPTSP